MERHSSACSLHGLLGRLAQLSSSSHAALHLARLRGLARGALFLLWGRIRYAYSRQRSARGDSRRALHHRRHGNLRERKSRRHRPAQGQLRQAHPHSCCADVSPATEGYCWFLMISELACSMLPLTSSVFTSDFCPASRPTSVSNVR